MLEGIKIGWEAIKLAAKVVPGIIKYIKKKKREGKKEYLIDLHDRIRDSLK